MGVLILRLIIRIFLIIKLIAEDPKDDDLCGEQCNKKIKITQAEVDSVHTWESVHWGAWNYVDDCQCVLEVEVKI